MSYFKVTVVPKGNSVNSFTFDMYLSKMDWPVNAVLNDGTP